LTGLPVAINSNVNDYIDAVAPIVDDIGMPRQRAIEEET
jgi:hypothetical protein